MDATKETTTESTETSNKQDAPAANTDATEFKIEIRGSRFRFARAAFSPSNGHSRSPGLDRARR